MKSYILNFVIVLILITSIHGCTKDEIVNEAPFFPGDCKIKSFYLDSGLKTYHFVHYSVDGKVEGLSINNDANAEIMYNYKFANQQLTDISKKIFDNDYQAFKYEYGQHGIEVIRRYELDSYYDIEGTGQNPLATREVIRAKFDYGKDAKPVSMLLSSVQKDTIKNIDVLTPVRSYSYEYDQYGNLVKEILYLPDASKVLKPSITFHHKYDDKPNSLRQLHYLMYHEPYSAPYMFSKNNKIGTREIRNFNSETEKNYSVEYDSNENVTKDGLLFSDIKWQCP